MRRRGEAVRCATGRDRSGNEAFETAEEGGETGAPANSDNAEARCFGFLRGGQPDKFTREDAPTSRGRGAR